MQQVAIACTQIPKTGNKTGNNSRTTHQKTTNTANFKNTNNKGNQMPIKPSEKEEGYFARMEFEKRKKIEEEKQKNLVEVEKRQLKELHYMRCPKCGQKLIEINYINIKIDKCSHCDGVWLDAGELEQISNLGKIKLTKWFKVSIK